MIKKCYSIDDLLCSLNVRLGSCEERICLFNDVLEDFFTSLSDTKFTTVADGFYGSGERVIDLSQQLYDFKGFYGYGNGCARNTECFVKNNSCLNCPGKDIYQIIMNNSNYTQNSGTFNIEYVEDTSKWVVEARIPQGIENGWVVYNTMHDKLTSYDDKVCIDPRLKLGFKLLLKAHISLQQNEYNQYSLLMQQYNGWLEKQKKKSDNTLIKVNGGNVR